MERLGFLRYFNGVFVCKPYYLHKYFYNKMIEKVIYVNFNSDQVMSDSEL